MKTRQFIYLVGSLTLLAILDSQLSSSFAQGNLTPPGAPAPTMKSLDQVEPRIAITNLPVFITQGGSYYLTRSYEQAFSSDAITIFTNNVTLDLCGFTIQQTGSATTVTGVRIENPAVIALKNVVVRNGSITGFSVSAGITCLGPRNCVFENLRITECGTGISVQAFGSAGAVGNVVRHCRTCDNTGTGVLFLSGAGNVENVIEDCESLNNATGFSLAAAGNLIVHCRASGNSGNNYTIAIGNREGAITLPGTNPTSINGSSGGVGSGNTDPFGNLSY
jgi:hypothetical protein